MGTFLCMYEKKNKTEKLFLKRNTSGALVKFSKLRVFRRKVFTIFFCSDAKSRKRVYSERQTRRNRRYIIILNEMRADFNRLDVRVVKRER